jgi:hypothetical protein
VRHAKVHEPPLHSGLAFATLVVHVAGFAM